MATTEEGVDQGAVRGARASVHCHAGRLVNGDDVVVFVEYFKGN